MPAALAPAAQASPCACSSRWRKETILLSSACVSLIFPCSPLAPICPPLPRASDNIRGQLHLSAGKSSELEPPATRSTGFRCRRAAFLRPGTAEREQGLDVLAVSSLVLGAEDGVGPGAVPAQVAAPLALEGDLIRQPAARHFPRHRTADVQRVVVAVGDLEQIRADGALAVRTGHG